MVNPSLRDLSHLRLAQAKVHHLFTESAAGVRGG